ncbi:hypothetical protein AOLI_G00078740 [Acnodon oligacanthus]
MNRVWDTTLTRRHMDVSNLAEFISTFFDPQLYDPPRERYGGYEERSQVQLGIINPTLALLLDLQQPGTSGREVPKRTIWTARVKERLGQEVDVLPSIKMREALGTLQRRAYVDLTLSRAKQIPESSRSKLFLPGVNRPGEVVYSLGPGF